MQTTIVIVTYKSKIIHKCIKKLCKNFKIIVVENSNNIKFKKDIESRYKNTKCILSGSNQGFARANNIGLKKVNTKFALLINPDVIISTKQIKKIEKYAKKNNKFSALAPNSNGFFETLSNNFDKFSIKKKNDFDNIKKNIIKKKIFEIDFIPGWCMYLNMKDIKKINYFDKNFFLYFEDTDLCKRLKDSNKKLLILSYIKVRHLFGTSVEKKDKHKLYLVRDWHLYWSSFYYHRKHYGFSSSLRIHFSKLLRFYLMKNFYFLVNNKNLYDLYKARLGGLVKQIFNKSAFSGLILK
tara:strand:+ start:574 stop:1461 length:888 start_codon:yes stop_codon:yes gene_type:complete